MFSINLLVNITILALRSNIYELHINNKNCTKEKLLFHGEKQQFQIHVISSGNKAVLVVETLTTDQLLSLSSIPK